MNIIPRASTKLLALFFLGLCFQSTQAYEAAHNSTHTQQADSSAREQTLLFSLGDKHNFPTMDAKESFDCGDQIYAVIVLDNWEKDRHELEFVWNDPELNARERTQYPFFVRNQQTKLWSWLRLSRATGAGMLQWLNPAAGYEEFIGEWRVDIFVDGKKILDKHFEVTC